MHISSHTGYLTLKQNGETELSSVHLDAVCCMIFLFFFPLRIIQSASMIRYVTLALCGCQRCPRYARHQNDRFMFTYLFVWLE